MRIAFVVFNDITALDFIGVYDPLIRLKSMGFMPELAWDVCSLHTVVSDDRGLRLTPTAVAKPLGDYDMVVVPGGRGTRTLRDDIRFITWLQTAAPCPWKVSVCTGALLLGAAGFLRGKIATTHPAALDDLRMYCKEVVERRIVHDGGVITGGGVTAAIDVGLYVVGQVAGNEVGQAIRTQMDYPYGSTESTPAVGVVSP